MNTPLLPADVFGLFPEDFWSNAWGRSPRLFTKTGSFDGLTQAIKSRSCDLRTIDKKVLDVAPGKFVFIHHAERYIAELANIVSNFKSKLSWDDIDASVIQNFSSSSTGAHFDDAHVLLIQLEGTKHVQMWEYEDLTKDQVQARIEKVSDVGAAPIPDVWSNIVEAEVKPGDILHIPAFWGHRASSTGEGLTLSIGLRTKAIDSMSSYIIPLSTRENNVMCTPSILRDEVGSELANCCLDVKERTEKFRQNLANSLISVSGSSGCDLAKSEHLVQLLFNQDPLCPRLMMTLTKLRQHLRVGRWGILHAVADLAIRRLEVPCPVTPGKPLLSSRVWCDFLPSTDNLDTVQTALTELQENSDFPFKDSLSLIHSIIIDESPSVALSTQNSFRTLSIPLSAVEEKTRVAEWLAAGAAEMSIRMRLLGKVQPLDLDPSHPSGTVSFYDLIAKSRRYALHSVRAKENK